MGQSINPPIFNANPSPYIMVPNGALAAWNTAKGNMGSAAQPVMVIGDSIGQGYYASVWYTKSWQGLVRAALAARYGNAGEYIGLGDCGVTGEGTAYGPATGVLNAATDYQWMATLNTPTTGWISLSYMAGEYQGPSSHAATDTYVLTPNAGTFTDFDLWGYQDANGAAFTVDANTGTVGSPVWVSQSAGSGVFASNGSATPPSVPPYPTGYSVTNTPALTGLASGAYKRSARWYNWTSTGVMMSQIRITNTGNGNLYIAGATIFPTGRAATGLLWIKQAFQGRTASVHGVPIYPTIQPQFLQCPAMIEDFPQTPKLVLLSLGVNDMQGAVGLDAYAYGLEQLARSASNVGASLVMTTPFVANYKRSDFPSPFTNADSWALYRARMRDVCLAYDGVFVDVDAEMRAGANPIANLYYSGSAYGSHMGDTGHAVMASMLLSVL